MTKKELYELKIGEVVFDEEGCNHILIINNPGKADMDMIHGISSWVEEHEYADVDIFSFYDKNPNRFKKVEKIEGDALVNLKNIKRFLLSAVGALNQIEELEK